MQRIGDFFRMIQVLSFSSLLFFGAAFLGGGEKVFAASDVKVEATVDRNKMNKGDALTLTVAVTSDQGVSVSQPRLPTLNGFELIQKWTGSETRSSFSGGQFQTVHTRKFNFQLVAPQSGKFVIGPVDVAINGKTYKTKSIGIQVLASGAPTPRKKKRSRDPFDDPFFGSPSQRMDDIFSQLLGRRNLPSDNDVDLNDKDALTIKVEVDKTTAYAGEQITASWYLYTRGQVRDIDTLKYPSLNGFWKEDIKMATHLNFKNEVVNGVIYKKALLVSYALFPIKPGKIKIDPYKAKVTVIGRQSGAFGFGRPVTQVKESRSIPITVKAIPENRPASFTGAVGTFEVVRTIDEQKVTVNQPFTLKVRFEGRGNAKLIDLPALNLPPGLELYDTKKEAKFFANGRSYREFEVLIIPRKEGHYSLPGLSVHVFDPLTSEFVEKTTPPIPVVVTPGDGQGIIPSTPLAKVDSTTNSAGEKSVPPLMLNWSSGNSMAWLNSSITWALALLLCFGGLFAKARKEMGWTDSRKNLGQVVAKRFSKINSLVDQGEWRLVGIELTNVVSYVLGNLSGEGGGNVQLDKLILKTPPSVRREIGSELEKLMQTIDLVSFAPENVVGSLKEKSKLKEFVSTAESLMKKALVLADKADDGKTKG